MTILIKQIIVDDCFPCYNSLNGPAFTKGNGNEIWVLILEKAYAKLYKSYERIEEGNSKDALNELTGAPTKVIYTNDYSTGNLNENLYTDLVYALSQ